MPAKTSKYITALFLLMTCIPVIALADPHIESSIATGNRFENSILRIRIVPRTPDQIAAFYEARGFPDFAIHEVRSVCFITVGLGNKSDRKLYYDLKQWRFSDSNGPVERLMRPYWKKRWHDLE